VTLSEVAIYTFQRPKTLALAIEYGHVSGNNPMLGKDVSSYLPTKFRTESESSMSAVCREMADRERELVLYLCIFWTQHCTQYT
jgi:hypothetical protein